MDFCRQILQPEDSELWVLHLKKATAHANDTWKPLQYLAFHSTIIVTLNKFQQTESKSSKTHVPIVSCCKNQTMPSFHEFKCHFESSLLASPLSFPVSEPHSSSSDLFFFLSDLRTHSIYTNVSTFAYRTTLTSISNISFFYSIAFTSLTEQTPHHTHVSYCFAIVNKLNGIKLL